MKLFLIYFFVLQGAPLYLKASSKVQLHVEATIVKIRERLLFNNRHPSRGSQPPGLSIKGLNKEEVGKNLRRLPPLMPRLTCFRVRSISMPWFHGAAGLARQSPAFPRLEMSTFCLRRFLKASAITITPSYVSAEVYCETKKGRSEMLPCVQG